MDEIAKDVFIERSCYESYPCQHHFIVNGNRQLVSAITIYNYCIKHNIPIPEHFKHYETMLNNKNNS